MVYTEHILGQNTLIKKIGEGGFGEVFSCMNRSHAVPIAVKICKENPTNEEELRFVQENTILHKLKIHPRVILPLSDIDRENGNIYYIMELADSNLGEYLNQFYNNNIKFKVGIFLKICDGLSHAHKSGVVHRDLWWNNVLVKKSEEDIDVKLNDFGRAKDFSLNIFNSSSLCVGHLLVRPPESCFELWDITSDTSIDNYIYGDLYALGIVLYYILTISSTGYSFDLLQRISDFFRARNIDIALLNYSEREVYYYEWIQQSKNFPLPALSVTLSDPSLSVELSRIIQKLCNIDYKLRYSSVDELIIDMNNLVI